MGKAGRVLRQVLETHSISQTALSQQLGMERSNIYRWVNEIRDPTSETVINIVKALGALDSEAAAAFKQKYFEDD